MNYVSCAEAAKAMGLLYEESNNCVNKGNLKGQLKMDIHG